LVTRASWVARTLRSSSIISDHQECITGSGVTHLGGLR
jgi:hypothetical protein